MNHSMSSSVEVSVMDMERRGWHTQATGITHLLNKEEDMMKEAYAQSIECEEPCEGRLSRTVLWEGEGETPSLYSTHDPTFLDWDLFSRYRISLRRWYIPSYQ